MELLKNSVPIFKDTNWLYKMLDKMLGGFF